MYGCHISDCKSDKDMHQILFTRSDLHLGAEHVLEHTAHILCSYPPESVVENRGSVSRKKLKCVVGLEFLQTRKT